MLGQLLAEGKLLFTVFQAVIDHTVMEADDDDQPPLHIVGVVTEQQDVALETSLVAYFGKDFSSENNKKTYNTTQMVRAAQDGVVMEVLCDKYSNMALSYMYRKGSMEVKKFCKEKQIEKIAVEKEGILLSKGRLLDEMNFVETAEVPNLDLGCLGVRVNLPLLERYSPLAYSIAEHIHWDLAVHRGVETCNRMSLENVSIIQGATLYKELSEDCVRCKIKRKKFLEAAMGPISDSQLTLAPPCWMIQVDLFGPITVKVPGFERHTRNRQVLEAECHVMTAVCPTTRLVNLQVMESTKAAGWVDAFSRLACEVGVPSHVFLDQDSAGMSAFQIAEVEFRDLELRLHREKGITFSVCGVGGHDKHGHVERVIQSVQQSLEDSGLKRDILHATGLQTLCKLVETQYNNLPLRFHHSRSADNTPMLRILTPNMLRVGRVNKRRLDGPIKLPKSRMDLLSKVEETYLAWFKIWLETLVPKLMYTPKWFKTDQELKKGDLVYFRKKESGLDGKWVIGMVEDIERGRDNIIRMVNVKYFNGHNKTPQFTLRTVRKMVKLWDIDDLHLDEDLAELQRKFGPIPGVAVADHDEGSHDMTDDQGAASLVQINDILLQVAVPVVADVQLGEGGDQAQGDVQLEEDDHPQGDIQLEEGADQTQGGAAAALQLADLRVPSVSRADCRVCCCKPHHLYSLHYGGSQYVTLPSTDMEVDHSILAMELGKDHDSVNMVESGEGFEDLLMSVNLNLS